MVPAHQRGPQHTLVDRRSCDRQEIQKIPMTVVLSVSVFPPQE